MKSTLNMYVCEAIILLPKMLQSLGLSVGLPQGSQFINRSLNEQINLNNGVSISLDTKEQLPDEALTQFGLATQECVKIRIKKSSNNVETFIQESGDLLDILLDNISFRMQLPLFIREMKCYQIDDAGVQVGEGILFPFPRGFQSEKFAFTNGFNGVGEQNPVLNESYFTFDDKILSALKWYHKSVAASFEIDKFVFLFIAAEVLCSLYQIKIKQHYRNQCGHLIENCPTCGATTERVVNGASIISYLTNDGGLSEAESRKIWEYRQILHGSNAGFKKDTLITEARILLQYAITKNLKKLLNIDGAKLPSIDVNAPAIGNAFLTYLPS